MTSRLPLDPAVPDLTTARLRLRRPEAGDASAIQHLANDWEVARWLARVPHPYTQADAAFFLEVVVSKEPCWALTERETGRLAGIIGLAASASADAVELGYWLGRPHWGRGFATEAARAVVRHAFETAGLKQLHAGHLVGNARSARVLGKLGFHVIGHSQRHSLAQGATLAHVDLVLTRDVRRAEGS